MKIKQLDHLNMTVSNLEESLDWYQKVFGFEKVEEGVRNDAPWAIIKSGEALLCVYEDASRLPPQQFLKRGGERHTIYHFGFRVTDRDEWLDKVSRFKLQLEYGGETDYPYSKSWYVFDPTGYGIEVVLWNEDRIAFDPLEPQSKDLAAA